jgi:ribonuclease HI
LECIHIIVRQINMFRHQNSFSLCRIKSHVGFEGNELADTLAKGAASKTWHYAKDRLLISEEVI